ncbi:MAG: ferredoxin [Chitinivibrionales bacterium]|nr:ferredoxin [Chitinivibrionales bacterium]
MSKSTIQTEWGAAMKISMNTEKCANCEFCALSCPEIFAMNASGKAEIKTQRVPQFCLSACQLAIRGCPVDAISLE